MCILGEGRGGGVEKYYCSSSRSCRRKYEEDSITYSPGWVSWRVDRSSSKESVLSSIPLFFVKRNSWYCLSIPGWSFPCSVRVSTRNNDCNAESWIQWIVYRAKRRCFHFICCQKNKQKYFPCRWTFRGRGEFFFNSSYYIHCIKMWRNKCITCTGWRPGIEAHSTVAELSGPNRIVVFEVDTVIGEVRNWCFLKMSCMNLYLLPRAWSLTNAAEGGGKQQVILHNV